MATYRVPDLCILRAFLATFAVPFWYLLPALHMMVSVCRAFYFQINSLVNQWTSKWEMQNLDEDISIQNLSSKTSQDQFFLGELSEVFRRTSGTRNLYPKWSVILRQFLIRYPSIWVRPVTQRWSLYQTWSQLNTGLKSCERSNSKTLTRPSIRYFSLHWKSTPGR